MSRTSLANTRLREEDGASAVEYGLIVFAIAALIVVVLWALGGVVHETYSDSCERIRTAASTAASC